MRSVAVLYLSSVPGCYSDFPGTGKTQVLTSLAQSVGARLVSLSAATTPPDMLGGVVAPDKTRRYQRRLAPAWVRQKCIVIVDEANVASKAAEDAMRALVGLRPTVCGYELPAGSWVCLAMNPIGLGGDRDLSKPMRRRVCLLRWDWSPSAVADYLRGGSGLLTDFCSVDWNSAKESFEATLPAYKELVASWVETQSREEWEKLAREAKGNEGFPTPYGAECAARVMAASHTLYPGDGELMGQLVVGLIGEKAAASLIEASAGFNPLVLKTTPPAQWGSVIEKRADRARAQLTVVLGLDTPSISEGLCSLLDKRMPEIVVWALHQHLLKYKGSPTKLSPRLLKYVQNVK